MRSFSKSKLLAYRQCPKCLWLEIHKPELRDDSGSEMVFGIGNQVGDVARGIYDQEGNSVLIDINALGHEEAFSRSALLLQAGGVPVFEAGMKAGGAHAYADVMLPDLLDGGVAWKMIEVRSSTSVKDCHRDDIAVQAHVAACAGVRLSSVSLAHIDNSFVYPGDGDYRGLLKEIDLTAEAISRSGRNPWLQLKVAGTKERRYLTGKRVESQCPAALSFQCHLLHMGRFVRSSGQFPIWFLSFCWRSTLLCQSASADGDLIIQNQKRSAMTATLPPIRPNGRGGGGACPSCLSGGSQRPLRLASGSLSTPRPPGRTSSQPSP